MKIMEKQTNPLENIALKSPVTLKEEKISKEAIKYEGLNLIEATYFEDGTSIQYWM